MGNMHTESFAQIWTTGYDGLRTQHVRVVLPSICETCPTADRGNVNNPNAFDTCELTYLPIATVTDGCNSTPRKVRLQGTRGDLPARQPLTS
jgi:hypothetical protein